MQSELSTLFDHINTKHSKTYTINTDYADDDIQLNKQLDAQGAFEDLLTTIGEYTGHIIVKDGNTYKFINKLQGIGPAYEVEEFEIEDESGSHDSYIVNTFKTEWVEKVFDETARVLKDVNKSASVSTGLSCGVEQTISLFGQGTAKAGNVISYAKDNIEYVLNTLKLLFEREPVSIVIANLLDLDDGQLITFDNERAAGWFVMTSIEHTPDLKTKLSGIGVINFK